MAKQVGSPPNEPPSKKAPSAFLLGFSFTVFLFLAGLFGEESTGVSPSGIAPTTVLSTVRVYIITSDKEGFSPKRHQVPPQDRALFVKVRRYP